MQFTEDQYLSAIVNLSGIRYYKQLVKDSWAKLTTIDKENFIAKYSA